MKVLLITAEKYTGLNYHRQLTPFRNLDIEYEERPSFNLEWEDSFLKKFSCVSFLRTIDLQFKTKEIIERLHKLGIKVHFDIDDYWELPEVHALYRGFVQHKVGEQVVNALKGSDLITTTTTYLAEKIKKYNKNVEVLPNAINPEEEQWEINHQEHPRVRIGYIAGVHHLEELQMLYPNLQKLWKVRDLHNQWQLCPAGFNLNKTEKGMQMNAYYNYVERVFTNEYKNVNKNYEEYLKLNNPENNDKMQEVHYKRLWGLDTFNYAKLYDLVDVSLAPLIPNEFSQCKSELKMIEAGFKKKPIIVSNIAPYTILADKYNSIMVNHQSRNEGWYFAMRKLIREPELREDLAEQLYEDVKDTYHINTVNKKRKQLLEKLCE